MKDERKTLLYRGVRVCLGNPAFEDRGTSVILPTRSSYLNTIAAIMNSYHYETSKGQRTEFKVHKEGGCRQGAELEPNTSWTEGPDRCEVSHGFSGGRI